MKVPLAWLNDYIDLADISTDEIVRTLAALGFPVESVERRPRLCGVLIGRIAKIEKHPNADRLYICALDVGSSASLRIVTAATNVAQGQIVPVATIGAELVGITIAPRKMRGVDSEGMLCSAGELGFEGAWFEDGILQLEPDLTLGADAITHYGLAEDVLEIEVTSNRADVMSMIGVARELGAAYGKQVRNPIAYEHIPSIASTDGMLGDLRISLESLDCRRFVAQRFSDVRVTTAPAWMRIRLALAGQRPINNLVDISNFVMLELGQPQHYYDFEKLAGKHLIARDAREGEIIETLGGEVRTLPASALVIADERQAQGLAGLKGAATSEISVFTHEIVLESASFTGARVRRMSVQQGLRTEASARHEKSLPFEVAEIGAGRAAALLIAQGATAHRAFAVGAEPAARAMIGLTSHEIRRILGMRIASDEVERALRGLGFEVRSESWRAEVDSDAETAYLVRSPYWRNDVMIPADVIEEVARIVGYDRIEAQLPAIVEQEIPSSAYEREEAIADALVALGYREVNSLALQPASVHETFEHAGIPVPEPLEIMNPLSEDQRFLRFSLLPGFLVLAGRARHDVPLRFFELGHVFEKGKDPLEVEMVAWFLLLPKKDEPHWRDDGFLEFKGDTQAFIRAVTGRDADSLPGSFRSLHPGKTASLVLDGKEIATIGAVDPRLLAAYAIEARVYCGFARLQEVPPYRLPTWKAISRFPSVERDLALILRPEVAAADVVHAIACGSNGVLRDVHVFDEYRGPQVGDNRKSITVRVTLQRDDATLTDEEADAHIQRILDSLRERVGAHIRS